MSPRKRRVADSDVIETAARVVARMGAGRTRLADVAVEIGLAPATLLQRFGTRKGLLQAVAASYSNRIAGTFETRTPESGHLGRLDAALFTLAGSNDLLLLITTDFPELAAAYSLELRKQIAFTLSAAVQGGELSHCDVAAFARRIQLGHYGLACAALLENQPVTEDAISAMISETLSGYV